MRLITRLVAVAFMGFISQSAVASGATSPNTQVGSNQSQMDATAIAAIAAAHGGSWPDAYAKAQASGDPIALKGVRWLDYTRSSSGGRFSEITGFIDQNPDWPLQKTLRRRAEESLTAESDDTADAWFKKNPPASAMGMVRAAEIQLNRGSAESGAAAMRNAWINGDFLVADELRVGTKYAAILRPEDHQKRLDRLIWDGQPDPARRLLGLVPADYRPVAEARLALASDVANADAVLAKLSPQQRLDPGLAFEQARWLRKKDNYDAAAQILLAHNDNAGRASAWLSERMMVARRLMVSSNPDLALKLVEPFGSGDDAASADAEFLCGYINLRFRKDPKAAFERFAHLLSRVNGPFAKARAAYWAGRAAAASDDKDLATKWFTVGAENMATFYGQLSAHELGKDAPPHPEPEARPTPEDTARFDALDLVHAAKLFFAAGDRDHARTLLMHVADKARTAVDFGMLASLCEAQGRVDLAIAVAKRAIDAGLPLMVHGYPVTAVPTGGVAETPLLLAIVRQESGFAPDAMSRVGARGLMQLMPATALNVAAQLQLPFSLDRLTTDGAYNLTLGRSYIEKLIDDFGGSYALAIAAYNAGPGRVRQWVHDFGDPRGADIGMVDWIEMIPFNETRAYVQRVLENLQIYRGQGGTSPTAFSLAADLAR